MNILAVDTSTSLASLAVVSEERLLGESLLNTDRTLSARIIPEIQHLLEGAGLTMAGIDLFAASVGPGSFTGVRAGVATIQGLALATGKPCAAFSSLASLALNFPCAAHPVCSLLDARKGEVYAALFDCSAALPVTRLPECVVRPELLLERIAAECPGAVIFTGDGSVRYRDLILERLGSNAVIPAFPHTISRAANGALLALDSYRRGGLLGPHQLLPVYLRASDAEYAKLDRQKSLKSK